MDVFEEFQSEEYGKIAEAHFNTNSAIASFFKYYLALMAVPISFLGFVATGVFKDSTNSQAILREAKPILAFVFFSVGLAGFLIMIYVMNLRFDALLYARSVNAIRKFFYDRADLGFIYKNRIRVLPQDPNQPPYLEVTYFLVVILTFAALDGVYMAFAGVVFADQPNSPLLSAAAARDVTWWWWEFVAIFVFGHPALYWYLSRRRETEYLTKRALGVDIDGVLNMHREHFCSMLLAKGLGVLLPAEIRALPVHRTPGTWVTREHEIAIFHDADYWLKMPVAMGAATHVRDIRKLGIKVIAVTARPWPLRDTITTAKHHELAAAWRSTALSLTKERGWFARRYRRFVDWTLGRRPIFQFTQQWMKDNDIAVDELIVEGGQSRRPIRFKRQCSDRIDLARARHMRFFVEDDPINALKLASVCDVVFLFDHPYNEDIRPGPDPTGRKPFAEALPDNVIRVTNWSDVYQIVRRLV